MSQALFERDAGGRHTAASASTAPAQRVHPEVVKVMHEIGIDLADRRPRLLTRDLAGQADTGHGVLLDDLYDCSANRHSGPAIGRGSSNNCYQEIARALRLEGATAAV